MITRAWQKEATKAHKGRVSFATGAAFFGGSVTSSPLLQTRKDGHGEASCSQTQATRSTVRQEAAPLVVDDAGEAGEVPRCALNRQPKAGAGMSSVPWQDPLGWAYRKVS